MLVVVDGVFSMEGDVAAAAGDRRAVPPHGARLMVDEAHGAGVLGARGAGATELLGVEDDVDLRMGTFSKSLASCGGFLAGSPDVIDFLRIRSARSSSRPPTCRRRSAPRWPRCGSSAPTRGRRSSRACSRTPATCATGCASAASRSSSEAPGDVTPIVPVLVGDDWKAVLLWKALWDAGVFVNVALHPAVPPGGALLRTSVMATHDAALDRALDVFSDVKAAFEAEHGPLPQHDAIRISDSVVRRSSTLSRNGHNTRCLRMFKVELTLTVDPADTSLLALRALRAADKPERMGRDGRHERGATVRRAVLPLEGTGLVSA